jgi:hypothetical protein
MTARIVRKLVATGVLLGAILLLPGQKVSAQFCFFTCEEEFWLCAQEYGGYPAFQYQMGECFYYECWRDPPYQPYSFGCY